MSKIRQLSDYKRLKLARRRLCETELIEFTPEFLALHFLARNDGSLVYSAIDVDRVMEDIIAWDELVEEVKSTVRHREAHERTTDD